jgi:pimeloyl-ACP methyl ester carboxylesterase
MTHLHYLDPNPSGPRAVLLLHGLGADSGSWALQLPVLAGAGYRPIAPDVAGFGLSPYDGRGWTIRRVAAQLAQLLEELDCTPAHLVGISMGGVIAQQLTLDFPGLVRRLVLANTFAVLRPADAAGWIYFLRRLLLVHTLGLEAQARFVAARIFPGAEQGALRELLVASIARADPRAYRRAMFSLGTFDSRKRLDRICTPTLIISGAEDTTVGTARQEWLARAIPGARQVVIPGAGHAVTVEQADRFNRELLAFLE